MDRKEQHVKALLFDFLYQIYNSTILGMMIEWPDGILYEIILGDLHENQEEI